jgi:hypothetical protein
MCDFFFLPFLFSSLIEMVRSLASCVAGFAGGVFVLFADDCLLFAVCCLLFVVCFQSRPQRERRPVDRYSPPADAVPRRRSRAKPKEVDRERLSVWLQDKLLRPSLYNPEPYDPFRRWSLDEWMQVQGRYGTIVDMMRVEDSGVDYFWWDEEMVAFQSSLHVMPRDQGLFDEIQEWFELHGRAAPGLFDDIDFSLGARSD